MNLSLYLSEPEQHHRPQGLERLAIGWTRDWSAGLRHGDVLKRICIRTGIGASAGAK